MSPRAEVAARNGKSGAGAVVQEAPLLELRGIRAAYEKVEVLHGIDLAAEGGQLLAVLGPNGAGKTTMLRVTSGLLKPSAGRFFLEGYDVTGVPVEQLAKAGVCLIPEGRGIFPNLTVRENILMDTYASGRPPGELEELAYHHFPRLGERVKQVAGTLSGGEQQMLALSRALSTDPALILLDELSMGLAPIFVEELYAAVQGLTDTGVTIVVVEQFADVVLDFAHKVALMGQGKVRFFGEPHDVRDHLAAVYLGGATP